MTTTTARFERHETRLTVNNEYKVRSVLTFDNEDRTIQAYFVADDLGTSRTFDVSFDDFDAWKQPGTVAVCALGSWLREHGLQLNRTEPDEPEADEAEADEADEPVNGEADRVIGHVGRNSLRQRLQNLVNAVDNFDYTERLQGSRKASAATLADEAEAVADAADALVSRVRCLARVRIG